jgi:hypothetical protein
MALADIYQKATLVQIPSGYKAADAELYSVVPNTTAGDFTVSVDADATRVNKDGLIESVLANQARLDYNPTTPQDPTLLLEPTRNNFNTNSENFSSGYSAVGSPVSVENNLTSPNGGINAAKQTIATTGNGYYKFPTTVTSGTDYTVSAFFKYISGAGEVVRFGAAGGTFGGDQQNRINIKTGVVEFTNTGNTVVVEEYPNKWYRVSCTKDATSSGSGGFSMYTNADDMVFGWWGVQFEAGSYPSSYIPTSGSAVTRTVDSVQINDFANAPTDYPFSIFCDFDLVKTGQKSFMFSFLWLAAFNNYFTAGYNIDGAGNFFKFENRAQGTALGVRTTNTYTEGRHKLAVKFVSSTNFKAFVDGVEVADHTHTSISFNSNIKDFILGQLRVVSDTGDRTPIHQFMVFNEALTDAELITLTT